MSKLNRALIMTYLKCKILSKSYFGRIMIQRFMKAILENRKDKKQEKLNFSDKKRKNTGF